MKRKKDGLFDMDRGKSLPKDKKKKEDKLAKVKKNDNDDDDGRDDDAKKERYGKKDKKDKSRIPAIADPKVVVDLREGRATNIATPTQATRGLSAEAGYITMAEAINCAKAEGGSGDVLKVDLEWDLARSVATWDVTFSAGVEYEIEETTGNLLGTKPKALAKLAVLSPLSLNEPSAKGLLTFQEIIRKAEMNRGQTVMEMELKRIKGRSETVYEVVLADDATILYDAATGNTINGI
jgi:uncharacterized membrane protein YkoI